MPSGAAAVVTRNVSLEVRAPVVPLPVDVPVRVAPFASAAATVAVPFRSFGSPSTTWACATPTSNATAKIHADDRAAEAYRAPLMHVFMIDLAIGASRRPRRPRCPGAASGFEG